MNVSSSLRDHHKKPDLIWMFTKIQDFETLKNKYKAASDEIAKLKTQNINLQSIKTAPEKTFL